MPITPNDLLLFARVVDEGSFTRAAERLDLPKSTVSRRVAALEAGLGERLRVSMPADFANVILAELLASFIARYPAITLEIDLSPRRVDLIGENFDVAIRMGALPDDASLAARQLAAFATGLYAAPDYLKRRGSPATPADLMQHDALLLLTRSGDPMPWTLTRGTEVWEGLPPGRATINSPEVLTRLARLGSGIAIVNSHFAVPYVTSGELAPVLPDWSPPVATAWAVFPGRRLMPARTRVFIDALAEEFSGPRCRAAEARLKKSASAPQTAAVALDR